MRILLAFLPSAHITPLSGFLIHWNERLAAFEPGIIPDIVVGTSMGALVGRAGRALTLRRILGYLDVRIGSSGLIGGGRLARRLEQAIGTTSIEDLPVRFAAIATEVGTGDEIWLTRGSLALALRVSYALPGYSRRCPAWRALAGRWCAGQSGAAHCGTRVRRARRQLIRPPQSSQLPPRC
jgi:hypothetical protein